MKTSHPLVRGSVIAGQLIGATFSQNFGRDGMWEGTVTKVRESTEVMHGTARRACDAIHLGPVPVACAIQPKGICRAVVPSFGGVPPREPDPASTRY